MKLRLLNEDELGMLAWHFFVFTLMGVASFCLLIGALGVLGIWRPAHGWRDMSVQLPSLMYSGAMRIPRMPSPYMIQTLLRNDPLRRYIFDTPTGAL